MSETNGAGDIYCPVMSVSAEDFDTHYSYPNGGAEHLIVPKEKRFRQIGISFFMPYRKRAALRLKSLRNLHKVKPRRHFNETQIMKEIKLLAGSTSLRTVVSLGTPGPYNKNTVLMLNDNATPVSVVKIGATPKAVGQVKREAEWLKLLTAEPKMAGWTPSFIAESQIQDAHVLVQSACAGSFAGKRLLPVQLRFLSLFQNMFQEEKPFRTSVMSMEINRRIELLKSKLAPEWNQRVQMAMFFLNAGLAHGPRVTVAAHRDFSPWNMRITQTGLSLFDWEYASKGYLPLYDLFHFLILPIAAHTSISNTRLSRILREVSERGKALDFSLEKLKALEFQLLAYLLDVSLFYLEANDGRHMGDKVLSCFGDLIDRFDEWGSR